MEIGARVTKHQVALSAPLSLRSCGTRAGCPAAQRLGAGLVPRSRLPPPGCVCAHRLARPHFPTTRVAFESKLRRKLAVQVPGMAGLGRRPQRTARESPRENVPPFLPRCEESVEKSCPRRPHGLCFSLGPELCARVHFEDGPTQGWFSELLTGASPCGCPALLSRVFQPSPARFVVFFFLPCGKETGLYRRKKKPESFKVGAAVKHFKISSRAGSEFW